MKGQKGMFRFRILFLMVFIFYPVGAALSKPLQAKNVVGGLLKKCGDSPKTGFYRDGRCLTGAEDRGTHVACATVTREFLDFTKGQGNDLITPRPEFDFPGLKPGDKWCLCALRWKEAKQAGVAPKLDLEATHQRMLEFSPMKTLQE